MLNKDSVETIFPSHTCYLCAPIKTKTFGRPMAGVAVYMRSSLSQHVKQIRSQCDFAIFLQLDKVITKTVRDIVLCFPYIPPEASPYYDNKRFKGISLLDIDINNVYLVIAGDLNARPAELPDVFRCKNNVPDLEENGEIINSCSKEGFLRQNGEQIRKRVVKLLHSLLIINGNGVETDMTKELVILHSRE